MIIGRGLVAIAMWVIIFTGLHVSHSTAAEPPNILLVIADDMGLDASPCYPDGSEKPAMPNLERLCQEGVVFDNFYATPMCSSTRATIITGRYGFRTGVGSAVGRRRGGLPLDEMTLFQFLDAYAPVKYAHAVIGKWHLSSAENGGADHPELAGVGSYSGLIEGTLDDYYRWPRTVGGETEMVDGYITSVLTDEAIDWIDAQGARPWFLWLAHVAPHLPLHAPPDDLTTSASFDGSRQDMQSQPLAYYFAALEALDAEMGRLLDSIPPSVRDNTVIIFIGDNGTPNRAIQSPFQRRRAKASLYEGGIQVPMIVAGKDVTRHGQREEALINSTDIFATIANLAGIEAGDSDAWPEDSVSFAPLLQAEGASTRHFAYSELFGSPGRQNGNRGKQSEGVAIRDARWKYMDTVGGGEQLFDLSDDPYEQNDLLASGQLSGSAKEALDRLKSDITELQDGQ